MKTVFEQFNDLLRDEDEKIHDYVMKEEHIRVILENKGHKLVFASTPAHGYYGFVNLDGELFIVGEEDDGIQEEDVMDFFEVDEYGRTK